MLGIACALGLAIGSQSFGAFSGEAAGSPVSTQPLAANEVLLEVSTIGRAVTRADRATLRVSVSGRGVTEAAARQNQRAAVERVRAAATAARATKIEVSMGDVITAMMMDAREALEAAGDAPEPVRVGDAMVTIELNDVSPAATLREALEGQDGVSVTNVNYALSDDRAASSTARRQALSAARAEAEDYAAAMNMRIVRVVRVTERAGFDWLGMMSGVVSGIEREMAGIGSGGDPDITTLVSVGVDYALAPR